MATIMPALPRLFFAYIEPALCLFGALQPLLSLDNITGLLPAAVAGRSGRPPPNNLELLQALLLSTMMFGWALITLAVMFIPPANRRLVRAYVAIAAIMDFPHWGSFAQALGWEGLAMWRQWDAALWMQLLIPLGTFTIKVAYLVGLFGPDKVVKEIKKKK